MIAHKYYKLYLKRRYNTNMSIIYPLVYVSNCWYVSDYHFPTSSTAQGGGGSFKNRKPIGEVGCCESGMAERSH